MNTWTGEAIAGRSPQQLFGGNEAAYALALLLIQVSNVWDDIIDGDIFTGTAVDACFWSILSDLPRNAFYRQHQATLQPLIESAMLSYFCANDWEEARDPHGIELGHFLRYGVTQVIAHIVFLCLGLAEARQVLPSLYIALCHERIDDYRREILETSTDG